MAAYWSNFHYGHGSTSLQRPRWGWWHANIRINFSSPKTRRIVLPNAENRRIVCSIVWTIHRNVTERQRDRRTDRQTSSSDYSGLHCEQCGSTVKNKVLHIFCYTKSKNMLASTPVGKNVQNCPVFIHCTYCYYLLYCCYSLYTSFTVNNTNTDCFILKTLQNSIAFMFFWQ